MWLRLYARWFFVHPHLLGVFLLGIFFAFTTGHVHAQQILSPEKRAQMEQQLQQLENEANDIDKNLQQTTAEKQTLSSEIASLNLEVKKRELEVKRLSLEIQKAGLEIQDKSTNISVLSQKITKNHQALASTLLVLYTYDHDNLLSILLKNRSLSDFFGSLTGLSRMQSTIEGALSEFKDERMHLQKEKADLQDFEVEQQDLKSLQEVERQFLAEKKKEKDQILELTKGKESLFQQLLQSKKRDIATLKSQLYYLEKTGVTAEDAIRYADLAAKRTGIRTAFLLALLEVETGKQFEDGIISVGTNVGTGNWKNDLYDCYIRLGKPSSAETEKTALFQITSSLGLDPDVMPVSRRPSYGCGGAMGHAQFLPTTWLRFADRVAQLTGHNPPNPWNIEDAFTAAAVFLADAGAGAQTKAGETAAAKTYISGKPACTKYICRLYSSRILSLAKDIDKIL